MPSPSPTYDPDNIFARILRGEVPCEKVFECEFALAFRDLAPQAPVHVLLIPKGDYISAADFFTSAPAEELVGFFRAASHTATLLGLDASGWRLISNTGVDARQEVPHFHLHILGGEDLGPLRSA